MKKQSEIKKIALDIGELGCIRGGPNSVKLLFSFEDVILEPVIESIEPVLY
jgi:hypothetical protein